MEPLPQYLLGSHVVFRCRSTELKRAGRVSGKPILSNVSPRVLVSRHATSRKLVLMEKGHYFFLADGTPLMFAGLWERWEGVSETVESCTIVTTVLNDRSCAADRRQSRNAYRR